MNEIIAEKLKLLPSSPGVYKMYNAAGEVIYVGKAISLKNRVRQYFQANKNHTPKVLAMVAHVEDFEILRTSNETEALTLESNLIKQFRPKYNILLKDDKHFPYIRIDYRQDFPRVEIVRRVQADGAKYLGPFLSGIALRDGMNVVREHFPVRYCKKDLKKAAARRERPCLMYHVGKCCAPCSGKVSRAQYHAMLDEISAFLTGHTDAVVQELTAQMQQASDNLQFERAAALRDSIRAIERLQDKQVVISTTKSMADVFALGRLNNDVLVFALFVRDGKVIGTEKFRMSADDGESDAEILAAFLKQYYLEVATFPPEILLHSDAADMEAIALWLSERAGRKIHLHRPQRGNKAQLAQLAYRNCTDALEKDAALQKRAWERGEGALVELCAVLGLESIPSRLECFDNSHLQGRDTVSSMVVFQDGQPDKKAYRRFRIHAEAGGDDLIAMREALTRRFARFQAGDAGFDVLPDLLVIDGGQTQLAVAVSVLAEAGLSFVPVIGLAETNEWIYLPDDPQPIALQRNSATLHLLERIRDEAHRFAITYHRSLRQKSALFSVLDQISGIGERRKRALFDAFVTLDAMKAATIEQLAAVPAMNHTAAEAVWTFFHGTAPAGEP
ncbi:MAG: excinuclease ABC subunit UvrC, partial [Candidatus Aphodomorpha sp.]